MEFINVFHNYDILNMRYCYLFIDFKRLQTLDYFKKFLKPYCNEFKIVGNSRNQIRLTIDEDKIQSFRAAVLHMMFVEDYPVRFDLRGLLDD